MKAVLVGAFIFFVLLSTVHAQAGGYVPPVHAPCGNISNPCGIPQPDTFWLILVGVIILAATFGKPRI